MNVDDLDELVSEFIESHKEKLIDPMTFDLLKDIKMTLDWLHLVRLILLSKDLLIILN